MRNVVFVAVTFLVACGTADDPVSGEFALSERRDGIFEWPHYSHYEESSLLDGQMWMTGIGGNDTTHFIGNTEHATKGFSFRLVKE